MTAPPYDTQTVRRKGIAHQIHPWTGFATFDGARSLALVDAEMRGRMRLVRQPTSGLLGGNDAF